METTAVLRGVRLSAQKGRLVADQIRGMPVDKALNVLAFSPKSSAADHQARCWNRPSPMPSTTTAPTSTN